MSPGTWIEFQLWWEWNNSINDISLAANSLQLPLAVQPRKTHERFCLYYCPLRALGLGVLDTYDRALTKDAYYEVSFIGKKEMIQKDEDELIEEDEILE